MSELLNDSHGVHRNNDLTGMMTEVERLNGYIHNEKGSTSSVLGQVGVN